MTHDRPPADLVAYCPSFNPKLIRAIHSCIEPDVQRRCPSMERFIAEIRPVEHEEQPGDE
jgi:hypothetical protein